MGLAVTVSGCVILFLFGFLTGGFVGWIVGLFQTHARLGVPFDGDLSTATLPSGPTPKMEISIPGGIESK